MARGYRLTQREMDYIDAHPELFASQISDNLSKMYPEDNGGTLKPGCINRYIAKKPSKTPCYGSRRTLSGLKAMAIR